MTYSMEIYAHCNRQGCSLQGKSYVKNDVSIISKEKCEHKVLAIIETERCTSLKGKYLYRASFTVLSNIFLYFFVIACYVVIIRISLH